MAPRKGAAAFLSLCLLGLIVGPVSAFGVELVVAAVQPELIETHLASDEAFFGWLGDLADRAADTGAELVVFPEYVNVFYLLLPALESVPVGSDPVRYLANRWNVGVQDVPGIAVRRSTAARNRELKEFWSETARDHGVYLVAGTSFVRTEEGDLHNRLWVFDPSGDLTYKQDKVYLTPFERNVLNLEPGDPRDASVLNIDGVVTGLTICRDTFFRVWERKFRKADFWIDLKANGEPYGPEIAAIFQRALPSRLEASGVPTGLTCTLTGELEGFVWEGPTSFYGLGHAARSPRARGEEVVVGTVRTQR